MKFMVLGRNGLTFSTANTWAEAVEQAVTMSVKMGSHFRVGHEGRLPFERERRRTLQIANAYVEAEWGAPEADETKRLKWLFELEVRHVVKLLKTHAEPHQSYLFEQAAARTAHPAFRR